MSNTISTYHKGIDISANTGTPVFASTDGKVILSQYSPSYGNYIMIENGELRTVYAHCSKLLVTAGSDIKQGQEIAKSGATRKCSWCSSTF